MLLCDEESSASQQYATKLKPNNNKKKQSTVSRKDFLEHNDKDNQISVGLVSKFIIIIVYT